MNTVVYICFALILIIGTCGLIPIIIKVKRHPDFLLNELPEIFFNSFAIIISIVLMIYFLIYS